MRWRWGDHLAFWAERWRLRRLMRTPEFAEMIASVRFTPHQTPADRILLGLRLSADAAARRATDLRGRAPP